jgi:hypothetical protein
VLVVMAFERLGVREGFEIRNKKVNTLFNYNRGLLLENRLLKKFEVFIGFDFHLFAGTAIFVMIFAFVVTFTMIIKMSPK